MHRTLEEAEKVQAMHRAWYKFRARDEYRELMERAEALEGRVVIEIRE